MDYYQQQIMLQQIYETSKTHHNTRFGIQISDIWIEHCGVNVRGCLHIIRDTDTFCDFCAVVYCEQCEDYIPSCIIRWDCEMREIRWDAEKTTEGILVPAEGLQTSWE